METGYENVPMRWSRTANNRWLVSGQVDYDWPTRRPPTAVVGYPVGPVVYLHTPPSNYASRGLSATAELHAISTYSLYSMCMGLKSKVKSKVRGFIPRIVAKQL